MSDACPEDLSSMLLPTGFPGVDVLEETDLDLELPAFMGESRAQLMRSQELMRGQLLAEVPPPCCPVVVFRRATTGESIAFYTLDNAERQRSTVT